ncbi:MAG: hypothetical protein HC882_04840 [Acidobacteria bacterium]|nr:hypothetical protein [Acidobacteriota bacterium]
MTAKRTAEERVHPETRAAWRAWLEEHHTRPHGVWLVSYKKATGRPFVPYEDAVTEALCFGWIDSKPRSRSATCVQTSGGSRPPDRGPEPARDRL